MRLTHADENEPFISSDWSTVPDAVQVVQQSLRKRNANNAMLLSDFFLQLGAIAYCSKLLRNILRV